MESIKLIIFDMDGTLYDLKDVAQMSFDMQVSYLASKKGLAKDEAVLFLAKNHVYPLIKKDSKSATELFMKLGYTKEEWSRYREAAFDVEKICKDKAVDKNVIIKFSSIAKTVLLSSNAYAVIEKVLKHIDIPPSLFDVIICSDRFPYQEPFSKKRAMEFLSDKYCVKFNEMISFGDRFETDIKPMIQLGGLGAHIQYPSALIDVFNDLSLNTLGSSSSYSFYYK